MRRRRTLFPAVALAVVALARTTQAATLAANGDASIAHETNGNWTIAAGGASLTLAADSSRDFAVLKLSSPSGKNVSLSGGTDSMILVKGNASVPFGGRAAGFTFDGVTVESPGGKLQLNATFMLTAAPPRASRHHA